MIRCEIIDLKIKVEEFMYPYGHIGNSILGKLEVFLAVRAKITRNAKMTFVMIAGLM